MTDFTDEVRRRIQAALDSQAKHQSELDARLRAEKQRRQELAERSEQAGLLITQRFEEAVKASSGMLNHTAPEGWKKKRAMSLDGKAPARSARLLSPSTLTAWCI